MNNSRNNNWLYENPLLKNKNQRYPYDFGTGNKIERADVKEKRDAFLGVSSNLANQKKDDFLEGFNDPYGEKRGQKRKERFVQIRENADKRNWHSQRTTDPFLEGFNQDSTEENKWTSDLFKEKTPGILNPQLPDKDDQAFRGSQFESKLNLPVQKINSSPTITPAINRNLNAKNEFEHAIGDPDKEPVMVQYSNDNKASDFTKGLGNALKRSFLDAFAPGYLKPSAHTALWFAGAETYLKHKGYDTSAWLLKHSLQPNPEDVYRDDNSRIAQLIKNDPAFLKELDIAIANSDGKTLDATISVPFEQGDLSYSIHKNDIKLTGYKDDNGKWKISAKMDDEYNFSELMTGKGENGISLGTLANDVAHFSEKIGAITPYNIYVDFNIER